MTHESPIFDLDELAEHSVDPKIPVLLGLEERYLMEGLVDDDGKVLIPSAVEDAAQATALRDEVNYGVFLGVNPAEASTTSQA